MTTAQIGTAMLGQPPEELAGGGRTHHGLGAVGGNRHAEGEWAPVTAMPGRAALAAGLTRLIPRRGAGG
ncbi:MAG: hypothetical protein J2P35_06485 [Actinobacteria bacterium]|nr:hypothetical protein [Actinomycetota bacterium]MBO0786274.1 hypothetical protein [Actinomycetota bacterium]